MSLVGLIQNGVYLSGYVVVIPVFGHESVATED